MKYDRFVSPSGGSINGGIDKAMEMCAKQENLDLQILRDASGRREALEQRKERPLSEVDRKGSIEAYRTEHGRLRHVPTGWSTMKRGLQVYVVSPDGKRFNLYTNIEAYIGSRLLGLRA